jgi:serine phosphatase RsbU (regulator of sigma subunit)
VHGLVCSHQELQTESNLNEAEDNRQVQFGDERLLATLRQAPQHDSRQLIETLEKTIAQHRKGAEPNDDLTMLCLRLG